MRARDERVPDFRVPALPVAQMTYELLHKSGDFVGRSRPAKGTAEWSSAGNVHATGDPRNTSEVAAHHLHRSGDSAAQWP